MKYFYCLLLLTFTICVKANHTPTLFDKLNGVNACWSEQTDIRPLPIYGTPLKNFSDQQLIQLHLQLVETILRSRNTDGLSEAQKIARINNLNHLRQYWQINTYPINNKTVKRNPVFIDDYNTFCAVGYLIKTSGHEPLARQIAATNNLAYLRDMRITELNQWVNNCGLTLDELAWIQPAYPAENHSRSLGKGVNGPVYALSGNDATSTLYVAGNFTLADGTIPCNSIVAVNYDRQNIFTNTFTPLGSGLNGAVKTLYRDQNNLYAGGHFDHSGSTPLSNIAMWNGVSWEAMGELDGTVNCITKYNNQLYAAGDFKFYFNSIMYTNIAYWDGQNWNPICKDVNGEANALIEYEGMLIIGGSFTTIDTIQANYVFSYDGTKIGKLGNGVNATVRTLSVTNNSLFAGGDLINTQTDSLFGLANFFNGDNDWQYNHGQNLFDSYNIQNKRINYISEKHLAGAFSTNLFYYSSNTAKFDYFSETAASFASPNGEVFSILELGNRVFFGGEFDELWCDGLAGRGIVNEASNLAIWDPEYVGLKNINEPPLNFTISPNPTVSTTSIQTQSAINSVTIFDISGKLVWENTFEKGLTEFSLDREIFPSTGLYLITLQTTNGDTQNQKLLVE